MKPQQKRPSACVVCAKPFEEVFQLGKPRLYCGKRCQRAREKPNYPPRPCAECGTLFTPAAKHFLVCSTPCRLERDRRIARESYYRTQGRTAPDPTRPCEWCKEPMGAPLLRRKYHPGECERQAHLARHRDTQQRYLGRLGKQCVVCGEGFSSDQSGAKFCSPECRGVSRREVAREKYAKLREIPVEDESPIQLPREIACASCEHARVSTRSETGFICGLARAMECRPAGVARFWQAIQEESA